MVNSVKYPIIFRGGDASAIYDKFLDNSIDKNFKNISEDPNLIIKKKKEDIKEDEFKDENKHFEKYCKDYLKLPHILPSKKRIIAIGDLHGDYQLTIECLKLAKIIDDKLNWVADPKDTVVVQIGDQIDRCRPVVGKKCDEPGTTINDEGRDIDILELFNELNKKAHAYGGAVISLLGNHEIMNVQGNMSYVSYKGLTQFEDEINPETGEKFSSGKEARKYLFKRGKKYASLMACTRQTAVIIGSNLFVHAAIMPKLAKELDVKDLNILVRKWLLKQISSDKKINGIGKLQDILINYELSPFWPRILGSLPPEVSIEDEKCIKFLKDTLKLYKCDNMIIGHTPQFYSNKTGISNTCKGINEHNEKNMGVWRIDTGSSQAFDTFSSEELSESRKPSVLEILNDNKFNVLN